MEDKFERQADGSYKLVNAELHQEEPAKTGTVVASEQAKLESAGSMFDKFVDFEFMGVPIGAPVVAIAGTIAIDRLLIAKVDPTNKWGSWANMGAAALLQMFGKKFIGNKLANALSFGLAYEGLADWVTQAVNKVIPPTTTTTTTQQQSRMQQGAALRQAEMHLSNYYARAFGG